MFSLLYVCVLLSLLVTANLNYNPQKQSQTKIMSKLLCWQKNGCTVVTCDHEIQGTQFQEECCKKLRERTVLWNLISTLA